MCVSLLVCSVETPGLDAPEATTRKIAAVVYFWKWPRATDEPQSLDPGARSRPSVKFDLEYARDQYVASFVPTPMDGLSIKVWIIGIKHLTLEVDAIKSMLNNPPIHV